MKQEIDNNAMWAAFRQELALQGELQVVAAIDNALNNLGFTIKETSTIVPIPLKQGEHAKFCDSIQVGDKVTRNEDGVLVNLSQLNRVAKKQGEQRPILDVEIPFGAKDSELQEASYYIPEGFHAEIESNRVVIKRGEQKPTDKVEPKFNVGDCIVKKHNSNINDFGSFTITDITGGKYWYNDRIICDITEQDGWEIYEPVRQKPAWSEEDERIKDNCIEYVKAACLDRDESDECVDWLKSLRPQSQWKPSDEHYELEEFAKIVRGNLTGISKAVQELFKAKYLQLTGNKMYGGFKD